MKADVWQMSINYRSCMLNRAGFTAGKYFSLPLKIVHRDHMKTLEIFTWLIITIYTLYSHNQAVVHSDCTRLETDAPHKKLHVLGEDTPNDDALACSYRRCGPAWLLRRFEA